MDPVLKQMCVEVLEGDVDGEKFAALLIESGINPEGCEWDIASKLLDRGDEMRLKLQKFGHTLN